MKKQSFLLAMLTLSLSVLQSCSKNFIRGEGPVVTETRSLAAFTAVDVSGQREAEIIPSTESKVEITGYQNLVSAYGSYVSNGSLHFEYPNHLWARNDNIRLRIYTPHFSKVKMSGQTKVLVRNGFAADHIEASLSGNGELRFEGATAGSVQFHTSGNAKIYAEPLVARDVTVDMSGNARVEVRAAESLRVHISGNGEVHYWGNPSVTASVSGNGKTVKH